RSNRDWSSDVCSSDLDILLPSFVKYELLYSPANNQPFSGLKVAYIYFLFEPIPAAIASPSFVTVISHDLLTVSLRKAYENQMNRSEERRVGKESKCQS